MKQRGLLSLKLWQAIKNPPWWHPIFWWAHVHDRQQLELPRLLRVLPEARRWHNLRAGLLLLGLVIATAITAIITGLVLVPLLVFSAGLLFGFLTLLQVSGAIHRARQQGYHDLFCLTPAGEWGTNWTLGLGRLHQNRVFLSGFRLMAVLWLVGLPIIMVFQWSARMAAGSFDSMTFTHVAWYCFLLAALYADYVQSVVLGNLCGLAAADDTRAPDEARSTAIRNFLITKALLYGFALLPAEFLARMPSSEFVAVIALPLLRVCSLIIAQDVTIRLVWRSIPEAGFEDDPQRLKQS